MLRGYASRIAGIVLASAVYDAGMLKYLRIAVTAFCRTACVLLLVLWLRSYWTLDFISRINNRRMMTTIGSNAGTIYFAHFNARVAYRGTGNSSTPRCWTLVSRQAQPEESLFVWRRKPDSLNVVLPHWCVANVMVLAGVGVWLPWRFSLRTLLTATTLIAVALGTIVVVR